MNLADASVADISAELERRLAELRQMRRKCRRVVDWPRRAFEVREWLGLKQDEAAMYCNCTQGCVSMCEKGDRPHGAERLVLKLLEEAYVNRSEYEGVPRDAKRARK